MEPTLETRIRNSGVDPSHLTDDELREFLSLLVEHVSDMSAWEDAVYRARVKIFRRSSLWSGK